jgi:hypothetical protein
VAAVLIVACGKKGPPLPPLVRVPAAPADFIAERQGADVRLRFTVPAANTDGTKPANIARVEILRFTGSETVTDRQLVDLGTSVAQVSVKAPRNPDIATGPGEPEEEPDLEDEGLDQGSVVQVDDRLDAEAFRPIVLAGATPQTGSDSLGPLVGPPPSVPSAIYVAVAYDTRGRRGPLSRRVVVPLVAPPPPPSRTAIEYDETRVRMSWTPVAGPAENAAGLLPSRSLGLATPRLSYHVYDVSPEDATDRDRPASVRGPRRLTGTPISEAWYEDRTLRWGATQCYTVRTVAAIGDLALESDAPQPTCVTLKDTFPPAPPRDLRAVATERAISLIWEPGAEADLAGYVVMRATPPRLTFDPITPAPIRETTFNDAVPPGTRYVYAVRAIDRWGNISEMSNRVEDTVR